MLASSGRLSMRADEIGPYGMGVDFRPQRVNLEDGEKALRKMQHSCIF